MRPLDLITACLRQFRLRPLEAAGWPVSALEKLSDGEAMGVSSLQEWQSTFV